MGLEKAIASGKEHRKEYKYRRNYAKSIDYQCRNHGECDWCRGNRLYKNSKRLKRAKEAEKEWNSRIETHANTQYLWLKMKLT